MRRIFRKPDGSAIVTSFITPPNNESWEDYMNRHTSYLKEVEGLPYFDVSDTVSIPARKDASGNCLRCRWRVDIVNKQILIDNSLPACVHDDVKRWGEELRSNNQAVAINAMLNLQRIKNG